MNDNSLKTSENDRHSLGMLKMISDKKKTLSSPSLNLCSLVMVGGVACLKLHFRTLQSTSKHAELREYNIPFPDSFTLMMVQLWNGLRCGLEKVTWMRRDWLLSLCLHGHHGVDVDESAESPPKSCLFEWLPFVSASANLFTTTRVKNLWTTKSAQIGW